MIPSFTEVLFYGTAIFYVYILVYGIVNRICECCEKCAMSKAFGHFQANQETVNKALKEMKNGNL